MKAAILIGTSGWNYNHWLVLFYPPDVTGYQELTFHAQHFNTVENNSSFYQIASEVTYKTWMRMAPAHYRFSMKLNQFVTHIKRLELPDEVREKVSHILTTTQVLQERMGTIVIQLPPSFRLDLQTLETFLVYFRGEIAKRAYHFDVAIEFRNKALFVDEVFTLLKTHNVALVSANSSRYPEARVVTADFSYIRLHGPEKLFASKYSTEQLQDWATYIRGLAKTQKTVYVYFNNDFHGYALDNAKELRELLTLE